MQVSLCPMRMRALKISTIEPYLTRDGVDVVTYRCPIDGDIWRSVVVSRVAAVGFVRSRAIGAPVKHEPGRAAKLAGWGPAVH